METSTWIALAAAIFGGAGIKIVEKILNKDEHEETEASRIRTELRQDLDRWKKRAEDAEASEDRWRDKYYKLLEGGELHDATDEKLQ